MIHHLPSRRLRHAPGTLGHALEGRDSVLHALTGLGDTAADRARLHAFQLGQQPTKRDLAACLFLPLRAWDGTNPVVTWLRLPDAFRAGRKARLEGLDVDLAQHEPLRRVRFLHDVRALGPDTAPHGRRGPLALR